jgi:serine/threonine protein kinase
MVTEFMNCGTLYDFILNGGTQLLKDPRMYYYIARNVAKVMAYLHSKGKILRDLSSKSVMVSSFDCIL